MGSTTFSHESTDYTINRLEQTTFTTLPANTISLRNFYLKAEPALPAGTILTLGDRSFTVGDESENPTAGQEEWDTIDNPLNWTNRQEVTVSLTLLPDATLSNIAIEGTADGQTVVLRPAFDEDTLTYTARVGNGIDEVTLTATKNNSNATVVISNDDHTSTPDTADLDLIVGSNTLAVTVTVMDTTTATLTYTITITRAESGSEILVPGDWSLVPTGLSAGDSFRLLFLSSTRHDASSASIDTYNTFVQGRAANGHTAIQAYSDGFTVVGCTAAVDARDNTSTTYTSSDKGIPIYWLNGNKVADDYEDFYDGSWDDEANDRNQSGNNGPDTSDNEYYPLTGCDHNGTEKLNSALGSSGVTVARPNSPDTGHGPLSSGFQIAEANNRPMYALSAVFTIVELSTDATLSNLTIEGATDGESFTLSPQFDEDTFIYTAAVPNRFDAVTLTATKNHGNATVAITGDSNASTPNTADLDLSVGDNTLTVTVTAQDTSTTLTYTITVTRYEVQSDATQVPRTWGLIPSGLNVGHPFRLIFGTSTKRNATPTDIETYNTFVQNAAAAGHADIQAYSSLFRVLGSTETVDARVNTSTTYTSTNKGVPIYWLGGTKVADDYEDFYDETWDDEANTLDESGSAVDIVTSGNRTFTGSAHNGTEFIFDGASLALGSGAVMLGAPNSANQSYGPIQSDFTPKTSSRRFYGLSAVFIVGASAPEAPTNLRATASGQTQINLEWTAPAHNGGDTISGYKLERSSTDTSNWTNLIADTGDNDTEYSDTGLSAGTTWYYRVSAINSLGTGPASNVDGATVADTIAPTEVPNTWSLIPAGLTNGDSFRLIFGTSTKRNATPTDIAAYNTFIQNAAAAGHGDIQAYSSLFRVVGSTAAVDARINTSTTFTSTDRGVPIYWLAGNKVADDYEDFYDGSWDDEVNTLDESGSTVDMRASNTNRPFTGSTQDGVEHLLGETSLALGRPTVTVGVLNGSLTNHNPFSGELFSKTAQHRYYGLSTVFIVGDPTAPSPPRRLTATADGTSEINISWHTPAQNGGYAISGYEIEYSSTGTSNWSNLVANTGNTDRTYSDTGLSPETRRYYRVSAINSVGTSDASNVANATTDADVLPTVTFGPGSFTASENGATARVTVEISVPASVTIPLRVQHRAGATSADYSGVPRRLIFEDGNTIRSFTVTAVDDSDNDDDEKIRIEFKDLPAGFQAGARSAITVKLKDNDGGNSLPLFDPANELRNLVENTAPNQNVGLPITATDADGDSLTYTFRRAGHGPFHVRSLNRSDQDQIRPDLRLRDPRTIRRQGHRR